MVVVFGNMECTSIFGHMEVHAICFFTEVFIPPKPTSTEHPRHTRRPRTPWGNTRVDRRLASSGPTGPWSQAPSVPGSQNEVTKRSSRICRGAGRMIMGRSSSFWGARVMLRIWENEEGGVRKRKELDIYIYIYTRNIQWQWAPLSTKTHWAPLRTLSVSHVGRNQFTG